VHAVVRRTPDAAEERRGPKTLRDDSIWERIRCPPLDPCAVGSGNRTQSFTTGAPMWGDRNGVAMSFSSSFLRPPAHQARCKNTAFSFFKGRKSGEYEGARFSARRSGNIEKSGRSAGKAVTRPFLSKGLAAEDHRRGAPPGFFGAISRGGRPGKPRVLHPDTSPMGILTGERLAKRKGTRTTARKRLGPRGRRS